MRRGSRVILLLGILLGIAVLLAYRWGTPRLVGAYPPDGARVAPAEAKIRLDFSRTMQPDSLIEHLEIQPETPGTFSWQESDLVFTPDRPWQPGTRVSVQVIPGSQAAGLLTLPLRVGKSWSFTIRQPRLAYLYPSDSAANIYVLDPMSGASEALTASSGGVQDFDINDSGTWVYYSLRDNQGGSAIYRLSLEDAPVADKPETISTLSPEQFAPELILACPNALCRAVAISPFEDYLAYERTAATAVEGSDYPQVWLLTLPDGSDTGEMQPYLAGAREHQTLQPAWSPEGLLTYYDSQDTAFIIQDPKSGEILAQIPNQTGQPGTWHPNGRFYVVPAIFFLDESFADTLAGLEPLANSHLLSYNWRTGQSEDLTPGEDMEDTTPAFSPNGEYLVFARKYLDVKLWTPGRQIWLMQTSNSQAKPITNEPLYNHFEFAWNPAGSLLAYVRFNQSTLTEPPEIWVVEPLTSQATRLVTGGYAPAWVP